MATIVNNPAPESGSSGMGLMTALILLVVVVLLLVFGVRFLGSFTGGGSNTGGGIEVSIPDGVDVNIQTPQGE